MKTTLRLLLLAALTALGFWLWNVCFPSPEKIVRQRLTELARTATFAGQDSPIARALKARKFAGFFTPDTVINLEGTDYGSRTFSGQEEISEAAAIGFNRFRSLAVNFLDVTVRVAADRQTAEASCTAKVRLGEAKDYGVQELRFQFRKTDSGWLINRVDTIKTLS